MNTNKNFLRLANIILAIFLLTLPSMAQSLKGRYFNKPLPSTTLDSGFTSWQGENHYPPDKRMLPAIPNKPDWYMRKFDPRKSHDSIMSDRWQGRLNKFNDRDIFLKERRGGIPDIERFPDREFDPYKNLRFRYPEAFRDIDDEVNAEVTSCGDGNVPKMGDIDIVRKAWVQRYAGDLVSPSDYATAMSVDSSGNVYVTGYSARYSDGSRTNCDYATIKYNPSGVEQWDVKYNGPGNYWDEATAIAVDDSGNVFVTGYSYGSGTYADYATMKYNSSGQEQWISRYNDPRNYGDYAKAISVDNSGNVYVTGVSDGLGTYKDYVTIKYNSSGVEQWIARYNGPGNGHDAANAITIDDSGNVYVTGKSHGSETDYDYATIKYNLSGVEQWVARYNGPGNSEDDAVAISVDGSGNVYVTGGSDSSGTSGDYATIKYSPSGVEQWAARYDGPGAEWDGATAISLDDSANVYVTGGSTGSGTYADYATIKYNPSGIVQWIARYDAPGNNIDYATAMSVDSSGNVYVTGNSAGNTWDYATIKYNSSGVEQWITLYNGPKKHNDKATAISVDYAGNVFVAGYSYSDETNDDYATIKYNSSGVEQWATRYDGPGYYDDAAFAIVVDDSGNVYVTGYSVDSETSSDNATIKYNSSGIEQWLVRYDAGNVFNVVSAISVDVSGNVYVTGSADWDYATIKYNSSGVEQWVARYDGPVNANDRASAIAVDDSGNVYVTGYSASSDSDLYDWDYATIKYNSSGVEQWVARYDGPMKYRDQATAIAIDDSGNVYVTGFSARVGGYLDYIFDYATIKYNSSGVEQWVARYEGPGYVDNIAIAMSVDDSGNVFVTGNSYTGSSSDYITIKYDSSGVEKWVARYNGPENSTDRASALFVDGSGNVYVTGYSWGSGTYTDYATIKYNSSGVEHWVARYDGPGNSYDEAYAIAVDDSGSVYVTGGSICLGTRMDYATIKYSSDGKELWVIRYNGPENFDDEANAIAIDAIGNVYITGSSGGYYATIKYEQSIIFNASVENGLWSNPTIWSLGHVPLPSEDVMIQHNVVIDTLQQDSIQSLIIHPNGTLSIREDVGLLKVASNVQIEDSGKIEFLPGAAGMIIYESFINRGIFECGTSSVTFLGNTFLTTNKITFYDFISDKAACFAGDLAIKNKLKLNDDLNIRLQDTVHVVNPDTGAIEGLGRIPRGTLKRAIAQISQSKYRFESLNSYLQFGESGSNPHNVSITTYPDTNPSSFGNKWVVVPSHVDPVANVITADSVTGFSKWVFGIPRPTGMESEYEISSFNDTIPLVRRVYDIHADGGEGFQAQLSLRYEQSEVPVGIQEDSLKLFRLEGTVDVKEKLKELPKKFSLEQNYPNPFNPTTTIRYELPRESFVTLKVYNVLGQEVATLVNEKKEAGRYEVEFDGSMLTSGMYIYRMTAGDYMAVKKFLLLK